MELDSDNVVELKQPEKIKIKQGKIKTGDFMEAFKKFSQTPTFKGELIYKIKKEYRKAKEANSMFDEVQMDLIKQWGKKDENGDPVEVIDPQTGFGSYRILPENIAAFNKKIKELDAIEVEFTFFTREEVKGHNLTAFDLDQLDFIE